MQEKTNDKIQKQDIRTILIIGAGLLVAFAIGYLLAGPGDAPKETQSTEDTAETTFADLLKDRPPVDDAIPRLTASYELVDRPSQLSVETLVSTAYNLNISWLTLTSQTASLSVSLPAITPFCNDAVSINSQIRSTFTPYLEKYRTSYKNYEQPSDLSISYEAWLNGDVLSILITRRSSDSSASYAVYNLNVATGMKMTNDDINDNYFDMSNLEALHCTYVNINSHMSSSFDIRNLVDFYFFLGENGQLMLCQSGVDSGLLFPFDLNATASEQRLVDAYQWLFRLPDSSIEFIGGSNVSEQFLTNTRLFLSCLSEQSNSTIDTISTLLAATTPDEAKTICLQLWEDPSLSEAETATVKSMLKTISPTDYNKKIAAEYAPKLFPDIPAVTELVSCPENPTVENMVSTVYDVSAEWTTNHGETMTVSIQLPALTPISEDAIAINERIRTHFSYRVNVLRSAYTIQSYPSYNDFHYEVWINGDIVSILITGRGFTDYASYYVYSLNIATGEEMTTTDLAREYYDMSYPEFLQCSLTWARNYYKDSIPESTYDKFDADVWTLSSHTLFLGENEQIMHCGNTLLSSTFLLPFDGTVIGPASAQREKDAYHWFFTLRTDGAISASYSSLLADAFLLDPQNFVSYLTLEEDSLITGTVSHLVYGLIDDYSAAKTICQEILNEGVLSDPEIAVVDQILTRIASKEYT